MGQALYAVLEHDTVGRCPREARNATQLEPPPPGSWTGHGTGRRASLSIAVGKARFRVGYMAARSHERCRHRRLPHRRAGLRTAGPEGPRSIAQALARAKNPSTWQITKRRPKRRGSGRRACAGPNGPLKGPGGEDGRERERLIAQGTRSTSRCRSTATSSWCVPPAGQRQWAVLRGACRRAHSAGEPALARACACSLGPRRVRRQPAHRDRSPAGGPFALRPPNSPRSTLIEAIGLLGAPSTALREATGCAVVSTRPPTGPCSGRPPLAPELARYRCRLIEPAARRAERRSAPASRASAVPVSPAFPCDPGTFAREGERKNGSDPDRRRLRTDARDPRGPFKETPTWSMSACSGVRRDDPQAPAPTEPVPAGPVAS
jgi:hypothetical protein